MQKKINFNIWRLIPIITLIGLLSIFLINIYFKKKSPFITSVLIEKTIPNFTLIAQGNNNTFNSKNFYGTGNPKIINFWSSWCKPCHTEYKELKKLKKLGIKIYGITYKDSDKNILKFLKKYGNIYEAIGKDNKNQIHIDFGVHKIPETFIIDNKGLIRFKQIGPITHGLNFNNFIKQYEKAKINIKK